MVKRFIENLMVKRVAGAGDLKLSHDLVVEDLVIHY